MPARHPTAIFLALALAGIGCAEIFPATKANHPGAAAKPRVQKEAARRRDGSDVTLPRSADPGRLIGMVVPCDPADSAAVLPRTVTECQHVDPKGDIMRPQVDTTTRKSP